MKKLVLITILFAAVFCVLLSSCNVKNIAKSKTDTALIKEENTASLDTGKVKTELVTETVTNYGDSLITSLYFYDDKENDNVKVIGSDSAENTGIKVKGTLEKTPFGYKLNLGAIALPVKQTSRSTLKTEERKGLSVNSTVKTDSTSLQKNQTKHIEPKAAAPVWLLWYLLPIFILAIIARACYVIWKRKRNEREG